VKENALMEPASDTGQTLLGTEKLLLDAFQNQKFPAVILRVAGIYGPGRTHLLNKFIHNQVRLSGHGDRFLNMIHRDDLVGLVIAALKNGRAGEVYNAVDDEPVTELHFYRWLAETLGKWLPPSGNEADVTGKRSGTNKRVLNRKIKMELGFQYQYPTFRQGYTAELTRLERAGALEIQPETR
jgi:nucleoside-diphosphate-sugar epimerase